MPAEIPARFHRQVYCPKLRAHRIFRPGPAGTHPALRCAGPRPWNSAGRRLAFDRMYFDGPQPPHPKHIHLERATDTVAIKRADQIVDAVDVYAVELDHDIAGQQAGLRCRPVGLDLRQQGAQLVFDAGDHRMPSRYRRRLARHADIGAPDIPVADDFGQHELRGVAGDRKANALRAADDGGIDADHLGAGRHQRAAGVAGIERGVGLNDVFDRPATHRADRAAQRRHHARRHTRFEAERIADRDHQLAAAQVFGIAERSVTQIARAVGAEQCEIGVGIDAEHACIGDDAFIVTQPDRFRGSDHVVAERNIAHRIIEEFMLAANEAVAGHLETAGIPSIYRIHEMPEAKRVLDFEEIASHFGYSLGAGPIAVRHVAVKERKRDGRVVRKPVTLAKEEFAISSRNYQRLIAKVAGKPEERILSYLMLRSLKQARYSNENRGHFALAAQSYTHFTSPIRRYPDLIVHRVLKHYLATKTALLDEQALHQFGDDCSFTERRAAEAERELIEWKKVKFMENRVGEEFDALIISTTKFGFFVELTELFVEGLVPMETLPGDRFQFHEPTRQIIGAHSRRTFSIGDAVRVRLDKADPVERKLNFAIVEPAPDRGRKGKGKRRN